MGRLPTCTKSVQHEHAEPFVDAFPDAHDGSPAGFGSRMCPWWSPLISLCGGLGSPSARKTFDAKANGRIREFREVRESLVGGIPSIPNSDSHSFNPVELVDVA